MSAVLECSAIHAIGLNGIMRDEIVIVGMEFVASTLMVASDCRLYGCVCVFLHGNVNNT